jgi:uncharacterized protein (TIGR03083 family)
MQISPVYGDEAVMRIDGVIDDPVGPMVRQRARLAARLALLDDEQWSAPSRCEGWTVQDVVAHLSTTNQFWAASIEAGRQGAPTEILDGFDPVTTPELLVASAREQAPAETLERFVLTGDALEASLRDVDAEALSTPAEAPPGHIALRLVVMHALWDSWIHERDIALPLGLDTVDEPDEIAGSLVYAAALGPTFLASVAAGRRGSMHVTATEPDVDFVVELDTYVSIRADGAPADAVPLCGDAVALVEALSYRAPLDPFVPAADRWMLDGLAQAFDQV